MEETDKNLDSMLLDLLLSSVRLPWSRAWDKDSGNRIHKGRALGVNGREGSRRDWANG